jgi:hypothetical protein
MMLISALNCSGSKIGNTKGNVSPNELILEVNHYKIPCFTEGVAFCYLLKKAGEGKWNSFPDSIVGFAYKWGYTYTLKVHKVDVKNPPSDVASFKYVLDNILVQKKAGIEEAFSFALKYPGAASFVYGSEANGFTLIGQTTIECISTEICKQLNKLSESNVAVEGTFRHSQKAGSVVLISLNFKNP